MRLDKAHWPGGLLWHGWLPVLSGTNGDSAWAETAVEGAVKALGSYSSKLIVTGVCLVVLLC